MCGIAGSTRSTAEFLAESKTRLRHRGPDADGQGVDREGGRGLGQTRPQETARCDGGARPL